VNGVSISSILALASSHQHVADLLVADGKIALLPWIVGVTNVLNIAQTASG
jgi:hypothetical protein